MKPLLTILSDKVGAHAVAGNPITATPSGTFAPVEVVYLKMNIALSGSTTNLKLVYSYAGGSGRYPLNSYTSLDTDFLDPLREGTLSDMQYSNLYTSTLGPPNILVKRQCYVAIELSGLDNIKFLPSAAGIDTKLNKAAYYCGLTHYDSTYTPNPNPAVAPPDDGLFLIFDVQKTPPAATTDGDTNYTMYFQFDQDSGNTIYGSVDPAIKNRG